MLQSLYVISMKDKIIELKAHYEGVLKRYQTSKPYSEYEQGSTDGKISILGDIIEDLERHINEWED